MNKGQYFSRAEPGYFSLIRLIISHEGADEDPFHSCEQRPVESDAIADSMGHRHYPLPDALKFFYDHAHFILFSLVLPDII